MSKKLTKQEIEYRQRIVKHYIDADSFMIGISSEYWLQHYDWVYELMSNSVYRIEERRNSLL